MWIFIILGLTFLHCNGSDNNISGMGRSELGEEEKSIIIQGTYLFVYFNDIPASIGTFTDDPGSKTFLIQYQNSSRNDVLKYSYRLQNEEEPDITLGLHSNGDLTVYENMNVYGRALKISKSIVETIQKNKYQVDIFAPIKEIMNLSKQLNNNSSEQNKVMDEFNKKLDEFRNTLNENKNQLIKDEVEEKFTYNDYQFEQFENKLNNIENRLENQVNQRNIIITILCVVILILIVIIIFSLCCNKKSKPEEKQNTNDESITEKENVTESQEKYHPDAIPILPLKTHSENSTSVTQDEDQTSSSDVRNSSDVSSEGKTVTEEKTNTTESFQNESITSQENTVSNESSQNESISSQESTVSN